MENVTPPPRGRRSPSAPPPMVWPVAGQSATPPPIVRNPFEETPPLPGAHPSPPPVAPPIANQSAAPPPIAPSLGGPRPDAPPPLTPPSPKSTAGQYRPLIVVACIVMLGLFVLILGAALNGGSRGSSSYANSASDGNARSTPGSAEGGGAYLPGTPGYVPPSSSDDNPLISSWGDREKVQDQSNQNYDDYINGVQRYNGSNGEEQLPSGYNQAWEGDQGTRVLSNDSSLNPNVGSGSETFTPMNPSDSSSSSSTSSSDGE